MYLKVAKRPLASYLFFWESVNTTWPHMYLQMYMSRVHQTYLKNRSGVYILKSHFKAWTLSGKNTTLKYRRKVCYLLEKESFLTRSSASTDSCANRSSRSIWGYIDKEWTLRRVARLPSSRAFTIEIYDPVWNLWMILCVAAKKLNTPKKGPTISVLIFIGFWLFCLRSIRLEEGFRSE